MYTKTLALFPSHHPTTQGYKGVPVTLALLEADGDPYPTFASFNHNVAIWEALEHSIPNNPALRTGLLRVADCLGAVLHQAYGLPIATPDGMLAVPAACVDAVLGYVQEYTALWPSLEQVATPAQVR